MSGTDQTTQGIPTNTNTGGAMTNTAMTGVSDGSTGGGNSTPPDTTVTTTSNNPPTTTSTSSPAPDNGTVTTTSTPPDASPLEPAKPIKVDATTTEAIKVAYKKGVEDAKQCDTICKGTRWAALAMNWSLVLFVLVLCAVMLRGKKEG